MAGMAMAAAVVRGVIYSRLPCPQMKERRREGGRPREGEGGEKGREGSGKRTDELREGTNSGGEKKNLLLLLLLLFRPAPSLPHRNSSVRLSLSSQWEQRGANFLLNMQRRKEQERHGRRPNFSCLYVYLSLLLPPLHAAHIVYPSN